MHGWQRQSEHVVQVLENWLLMLRWPRTWTIISLLILLGKDALDSAPRSGSHYDKDRVRRATCLHIAQQDVELQMAGEGLTSVLSETAWLHLCNFVSFFLLH